MATEPAVPAPPPAEDATERKLKRAELRWKIRVAKADVWQKVLISIVGAVIAAIFYIFQSNQIDSRYYADLQAQRERADADLRANMFKTLFESYFKNKLDAAQKAAESGGQTSTQAKALLVNLGQEIMLSDLLARNFETVDVRPMFEDLDRRLTDLIKRGGEDRNALALQADAFGLREQLRRVAYGATARQIELLRANAKATVQQEKIEQCQVGSSSVFSSDWLTLKGTDARILIRHVEDGAVRITLRVPTKDDVPTLTDSSDIQEFIPPQQVPLTITYYDMPTLENIRLPDGSRLAMTVTGSASTRTCQRFREKMDVSTQRDCNPQEQSIGAACSWAHVKITLIPKTYISARDRPYLSELSSPRYDSRFKDLLSKLRLSGHQNIPPE